MSAPEPWSGQPNSARTYVPTVMYPVPCGRDYQVRGDIWPAASARASHAAPPVPDDPLNRDHIAMLVAEAYDGGHTQPCTADYRVADALIAHVRSAIAAGSAHSAPRIVWRTPATLRAALAPLGSGFALADAYRLLDWEGSNLSLARTLQDAGFTSRLVGCGRGNSLRRFYPPEPDAPSFEAAGAR